MISKYPYLKDSNFLKRFDKIKIKEQFLKIIVLTFDEKPIQQIQGKVISGNITIDGKSAMRRTANLSILADQNKNDLSNVNNLLSINKKVQILIGFTNNTGQYSDYPVIWFPQGIYVIITPSISHGLNGITISLTLHDKMAFLNGECGGTFPSSIVFDEIDDIDQNGQSIVTKPTIYQIIQELVNHWGDQQLGKILISDVDNRIKQVMKWTGSTPLYLLIRHTEGQIEHQFSTNYYDLLSKKGESDEIQQFDYGEDVGFIMTNFTYPTQLVGNAGDTIVTILDQIKNILGNYEYFYDVYGNFHFQEIKNYLNTSYSTFKIDELKADNYKVDYSSGKSVYVFNDADMIISFANNPQYQQIKNDFIVWGVRKTSEGVEKPIRYHLAMDSKPQIGQTHKVFFYIDPEDDILKAKQPFWFAKYEDFANKDGQIGQFYYADDRQKIYKWNPETKVYNQTDYTLKEITSNDFRSELYLQGVESENLGTESNYYYPELKNEWTKLYNLQSSSPDFCQSVKKKPEQIDYFLDFIDSIDNQFTINNIGRRTVTLVDDKINCLFQPDFPNIVIIELNSKNARKIREECIKKNQEFSQVSNSIYSVLSIGGNFRSAYEEIKQQIYQYTNYNEQVSLTMIPVYYLEPNIRITIKDQQSDILGDYMINNISLPLDINGTMTLSCSKATERL